jgi:hypothetical protein
MLHLSAAGGHHDAGSSSNSVSVSTAGDGFVIAETSPGEKEPGISYATLSAARVGCTRWFHFHSDFAAEFFSGDENGGAYFDRGSCGLWITLLEDKKTSLAGSWIAGIFAIAL